MRPLLTGFAKRAPGCDYQTWQAGGELVRAEDGEDAFFGALAGIAKVTGDIENSVPASDWNLE